MNINNILTNFWNSIKSYLSNNYLGKTAKAESSKSADNVTWGGVSGRPTALSQFTNDSGYITGAGSCNYANSAGSAQPVFNNCQWYLVGDDVKIGDHNVGGGLGLLGNNANTRLDFCQYGNDSNYRSITFDGSTLYLDGNCNYANSSGNADTLDGYHHDSFPKTNSALFTVNGLGSPGWSTVGTGEGGSCIQVKTTDNTYPSICFHRSGYSHCVLAESGGQLGTILQGGPFYPLITSANIGSQSVNYATYASRSAGDGAFYISGYQIYVG